MLQRIRDNASGPLAYVVVAVIALVFGVWGIGSYFTPSSDPVVASVGSTDITRSQLQRGYDQRYQRLRQLMGDGFDPSMFPPEQLRQTVLQGLINDAVLNQYAQDNGYRVTDAAVLAALRSDQQFQQGGQFSPQRYRALLSQAGIAPAQYEASLRRDLKSRQLRGEIVNSAFASPAEVDQAYRLVNQERRVRYLRFDPANYRDQVEVTDAQIKSYYDAHGDQFQRPERVKLAYVSLDRSNAGDDQTPDEQTLRALYEQNKAQLGEPETRSGGEIRVPIEGDGSAARDTVQKLAGAMADGDPQTLAEKTDGASYTPLDSVKRADLPPAVADALFAMKAGDTSSPVRGDDAWYLLQLKDVNAAKTPAFDDPEVQAQLNAIASAQQANQAYDDKIDRLESLAYEAPNDLKTLSDQLGLKIQHSDWLTRDGGGGLGQYDAIRKAAFSDAVLKDKLNSTPIQLGSDRRVVVRVDAQEPAQALPLDTVSARIRDRLVAQKTAEQARTAAEAALAKIKDGAKLESVAQGDAAPSLENAGFIRRSSDDTDARVREAAFGMAQPSADQPGYDITATSNGMVALVAVDQVRDAQGDKSKTPRSQFADQQRNYVAQQEYAALSQYLRSQADVEVNQNRVNP
ncbi:SurA N-terminal domain-containing protein [Salinisphaera aquimarina]|uniref:Periplasmic chaperone PpiD n=1 Tax=Salinisphaera aquimarina TaxID=2094031 RepID=A0ABV7ET62_9GAMM